eukprot:m.177623 g.177623  ORF g.177623 m.177623 type:complete len:671 (-) comp21397_c0_seq1:106-2118(-)
MCSASPAEKNCPLRRLGLTFGAVGVAMERVDLFDNDAEEPLLSHRPRDVLRKPRKSRYKIDWLCLKRLGKLLRIMFPGFTSVPTMFFLVLLGVSLAEELAVYNTGLIASRFYGVLTSRPIRGLNPLILQSIVFIVCVALLKSTATLLSNMLSVLWRQSITRSLQRLYFTGKACYRVNLLPENAVENPDQRVTQDVDNLTQSLGTILTNTIFIPLTIIYYSYTLNQVLGPLGLVSIYGYFLAGVILNKLLMTPIISLIFEKEHQEGNFRFLHMNSRTHAESAACYGGARVELSLANFRLSQLLRTMMSLAYRQYFLNVSINLFDYLAAVLSYFIVAVPIVAGKYDDYSSSELSSLISKTSFVSLYLLNQFTTTLDQSQNLSDVAGYTHRIGELFEQLQTVQKAEEHSQASTAAQSLRSFDGDASIVVDGVTYGVPSSSRVLTQDLSFTVRSGSNVLVTGPSGCGKTSLLRVVLGLWEPLNGTVQCPPSKDIMFLPQRPFVIQGSIFAQIHFPELDPSLHHLEVRTWWSELAHQPAELAQSLAKGAPQQPSETQLNKAMLALRMVGLAELAERAGGDLTSYLDWNWNDVLSQGELQRLGFARLFYHQPKFAVLDEASSALDLDAERTMHEQCAAHNITLLSVGHRKSLEQFHTRRLHLHGNGDWTLSDIAEV